MAKKKEYLSIDYYTLKLNLEEACQIKKHLDFLIKNNPEITNEAIRDYLLISGITDPILKEKIKYASLDNLYDAFDAMVTDMGKDAEALSGVCVDAKDYADAKERLLAGSDISNDLRQLLLNDNAVLKGQIDKRIRERSENHQHSLEASDFQQQPSIVANGEQPQSAPGFDAPPSKSYFDEGIEM